MKKEVWVITCGPYFFTGTGPGPWWSLNASDAKTYEEAGSDWGLPFAPPFVQYDDSDVKYELFKDALMRHVDGREDARS